MAEQPPGTGACAPADDPILVRSIDANVLTLVLNRPRAGNALSLDMIDALQAALDESAHDPDVHVIVLEGIGDRVFCAGHDLREVLEKNSPAFSKEMARRCSRMMQGIVGHPRPVIAKVRGVATAAGLQLVACADLAYAARSARFATPGVNIGLWCLTPMVALSRAVARKHAMQMLLTGRLYDAQHALRIGLVNRVAADADACVAMAHEWAARLAAGPAFAHAMTKQMIESEARLPLAQAIEAEAQAQALCMQHGDFAEAHAAFKDKRPPRFAGAPAPEGKA